MENDAQFYDRAVRRIFRGMLWVSVAGVAAALVIKGWLWAVAFGLGAAGAVLNLSWLHQLVAALGETGRRPKKRVFVFLALRYVILGAGGYAIVKIFGMNAIAALIGLFVPTAAIFFEIIYELIHERA